VSGEVRGFLSDRYRRLDSRSIIEAFATAVQQKGALPYDGYDTDTKVAMVDRLSELGPAVIEVSSFAHPKVVPHLRDAEEVFARIRRRPGVTYRALVPNARGARRAAACSIDEMLGLMTISATYLRKNQNMTIEEAIEQNLESFRISDANGTPFVMALAAMAVTPAGASQGFTITTFASGFPSALGGSGGIVGPMGITFPSAGGVLVADFPGNVRLFASDSDGQTAGAAPVGQNYGLSGLLLGISLLCIVVATAVYPFVFFNTAGSITYLILRGDQDPASSER